MKQKGLLIICIILLTGCTNVLASQAVIDAELAIEEQRYERANSLLHLASVESSNKEYEALHQQSIYLMNMQQYREARELDRLLLTWTELNLVPSDSNLIREEAVRMLQQMLECIEEEAIQKFEGGNPREMISFIRLIEDRMGTFNVFESEIGRLIELRVHLEEVQVR